MLSKTKMRYHYVPIRVAKIKNRTPPDTVLDAEKLYHSYIVDGL